MLPPDVYAADFHRFKHGAFDITVVSDGYITLPAEILLPDAPEERQVILPRLGGNARGAPSRPIFRSSGTARTSSWSIPAPE
jgi:hypothetical protein